MAAQVVSYRRAELSRLASSVLENETGESFSYLRQGSTWKHRSPRDAHASDDDEDGALRLHPLCAAHHTPALPSASSFGKKHTDSKTPSTHKSPRTTLTPPGEPLTSPPGNAIASKWRQRGTAANLKSPRSSDYQDEGLKMHPLCSIQTRAPKARHASPGKVHNQGLDYQHEIQRSKTDGLGLTQGRGIMPARAQARKELNIVIPSEGVTPGEEGRDTLSALSSASPASAEKGSGSRRGSASSKWTPRGLFSRQSSEKTSVGKKVNSTKPSNPVKRLQVIDKLAPASKWTGRPPPAPTSRSRFQGPQSTQSTEEASHPEGCGSDAPAAQQQADARPETPEMPRNACLNFSRGGRKTTQKEEYKAPVHQELAQGSRDLGTDFDPDRRMERQRTVERETWRQEAEFGAEAESDGFLLRRSTVGR